MNKRHICPNGCNAGFYTAAHVMQEWKVNNKGDFIQVANDCLEVTGRPHDDNVWTCVKCGAEGEVERE